MKTIAREIHEADADYVLALKAHHEVLHGEIQTFLDDALGNPAHLPAASRHQTLEKDHGRIETRRYLCTGQLDWLSVCGQWAALRSVAVVEAERTPGAKTTRERRYDLSSLPPEAPALARAIRGHWGIENSLHWVLDVAMNEDQCHVRTKQKIAASDHRYLLMPLAI